MIITSQKNENVLVLGIEGRLDTITSVDLEEKLDCELEGVETLIFDLEKLEYISSAGLRVLLATTKEIERNDGHMIVRNVSNDVMDIFEVTGFVEILNIE